MPPHPAAATIVLATGNPHKVSELRAIFAAEGLTVRGLGELNPPPGGFVEPVEHGHTFADNARVKAVDYARQTGQCCLADDSGLEIDALDGRPGVISSHYCSDGREEGLTRGQRDAANNARVLRELHGVPPDQRAARFVCCMCLADPSGRILYQTRGTFEGRIGMPPRVPAGASGFGYDPLFLVGPAFALTGAELPTEEKNRRSHRARAAAQMALAVRENSLG